jgi:hypothetical protein
LPDAGEAAAFLICAMSALEAFRVCTPLDNAKKPEFTGKKGTDLLGLNERH